MIEKIANEIVGELIAHEKYALVNDKIVASIARDATKLAIAKYVAKTLRSKI